MVENRIGVGLDDSTYELLKARAVENSKSQSFIISALLNCTPSSVLAGYVNQYAATLAKEREVERTNRHQALKTLKKISPAEIQLILAAREMKL